MIDEVKKMVEEVDKISEKYQNKVAESGENFNLFNILGIEAWENAHSKILAELLNPKGSHGQGDLFLKLFTDQLSIDNFDTHSAEVKTEFYIGVIDSDYIKGGKIDILISDQNDNQIIIENKIYADDQRNQLVRYFNYGYKKRGKTELFYLTLWGHEPSAYSKGTLTNKDYKTISYEKNIIEWLEECINWLIKPEKPSHTVLIETIRQYSNILKQFTKQTTMDKMKKDVKELILSNPTHYINAIDTAWEAQQEIVQEISQSLTNKMTEQFKNEEIRLLDKKIIKVQFFNENDGVWFGYSMYDDGKRLSCKDEDEISKLLLEVIKNKGYSASDANQNYIAWFFPIPFDKKDNHKFVQWSKQDMFRYANDTTMNDFVKKLMSQEKEVRELFLDRLSRENKI